MSSRPAVVRPFRAVIAQFTFRTSRHLHLRSPARLHRRVQLRILRFSDFETDGFRRQGAPSCPPNLKPDPVSEAGTWRGK